MCGGGRNPGEIDGCAGCGGWACTVDGAKDAGALLTDDEGANEAIGARGVRDGGGTRDGEGGNGDGGGGDDLG